MAVTADTLVILCWHPRWLYFPFLEGYLKSSNLPAGLHKVSLYHHHLLGIHFSGVFHVVF